MKRPYCFCSLLFLFISGCTTQRSPALPPVASSTSQIQNQWGSLHKSGIQIIKVGDEVRLILPNDRFFTKNTSTLKLTAYPVLTEVARLLNQKKSLSVDVIAYTPSWEDFTPNTSLAQQQAQAIVDCLLQHGLNVRLIAARAWRGLSKRQKLGSGSFNDDPPNVFSVEIRERLLHSVDSQ